MFDAKKLLDQFLGTQVPGANGTLGDKARQAGDLARQYPVAAGALAAVLLGTETGRKLGGSALKLGGMAAIAGLGYQAYRNWQAGKAPQSSENQEHGPGAEMDLPPPGTGFHIEDEANNDDFATVLVQAMIAAARADGHIDDAERGRILGKVKLAGLGADAEAFLERELQNPVDLDRIVGAAASESQRVELYTASRIAIEPDTRAERGYLDLLAGRLGLEDALIDHIETTVASAKIG